MGNIIFGYLFKIKDSFQKWSGGLFDKFRDPITGKLKYMSGANFKALMVVSAVTFFSVIIFVQLFRDNDRKKSSLEQYKKEFTSDSGVKARKIDEKNLFTNDPFSTLLSGDRMYRENSLDKIVGQKEVTTSDCNSMKERIKSGATLNLDDKKRFNECLEKNLLQIPESEKNTLYAINNTDSQTGREALLDKLNGKSQPGDAVAVGSLLEKVNNKDSVSKGLSELKKKGVSATEDSLKALADKVADSPKLSKDKILALNKSLDGGALSNKDVELLKKDLSDKKQEEPKPENMPSFGATDGDKISQMRDLSDQIKDKKKDLDRLNERVVQLQVDSQAAAKKISEGKVLTSDEAKSLGDLASVTGDQAKTKEELNKMISELKGLQDEVKSALDGVNNSVTEELASWTGSEEVTLDGSKKTAKAKKKSNKIAKKVADEPLPFKGRRVQPGQGDKVDIAKLVQGDGAQSQIKLMSDMKIAARLESDILVASNQNNQRVVVRIMMDVYDPQTNKIVISKGSVVTGTTSSFSDETGVMDLTLSKVSVGRTSMTIPFKVGSADGTMGLKGEIRDTRGRKLLGAFVTSFSAGALDWFGQNVIAAYQKSSSSMTAMQGAGLSGASEVMKKISDMYAQDLNNAPTIFYVPKGVGVVLFPDGE